MQKESPTWTGSFSCARRISFAKRMDIMEKLDDRALDLLFREARTHNVWLNRKISDDTLRQLYDIAKWGPTSSNAAPLGFIRERSCHDIVSRASR
jgi:hypothetical protein